MADLYQDITVTINLSAMTPEQYKRVYKQLAKISEDKLTTCTYSDGMTNPLSEEHKKLLETMKGE